MIIFVGDTMRKEKKQENRKLWQKNFVLFIVVVFVVTFYCREGIENWVNDTKQEAKELVVSYSLENIPVYTGEAYVVLNNNQPSFGKQDYTTTSFERYSELDSLGRCGVAFANIGIDLMPMDERGSIGMIKPTGWHTIKYENISGKYLYNRCHLIGYQLTGENANKKNLITCTRYMNTVGMLEFENKVAKYVEETKNHVLYRVTPVFEGNNLLASGVQIEAYSVEDEGDGIQFNVYLYNVQEGIYIDYATGDSRQNT